MRLQQPVRIVASAPAELYKAAPGGFPCNFHTESSGRGRKRRVPPVPPCVCLTPRSRARPGCRSPEGQHPTLPTHTPHHHHPPAPSRGVRRRGPPGTGAEVRTCQSILPSRAMGRAAPAAASVADPRTPGRGAGRACAPHPRPPAPAWPPLSQTSAPAGPPSPLPGLFPSPGGREDTGTRSHRRGASLSVAASQGPSPPPPNRGRAGRF